MKKLLTSVLVACVMALPLLVSASEVEGTLNSYSIKNRVMVVNGVEYAADIENLNITYYGARFYSDGLKPGMKVHLYINDDDSDDGASKKGKSIRKLEILTKKHEMDS